MTNAGERTEKGFDGIVTATLSSTQFLSRLPLPGTGEDALSDFRRSAYAFPLAGLIIALPSALALWGADALGLSALICALLAVAVLIIVTGALHEDGLADVADGFWGGHNKARKLEIMRDSAVGTYGVLALVLNIGLRVALLAQILTATGGAHAALLLLAVSSLSRFGMLQPWMAQKPARQSNDTTKDKNAREKNGKEASGLSARYGAPDLQTFLRGAAAALPAIALFIFVGGVWGLVGGLVLFQIFVFAMTRLSDHHIGGHTGDTLGATQQMSELGLYLGVILTI